MKYISDDGKIFNTEQECRNHEQMMKKERIDKEQRERLQNIKSVYEELENLVSEYEQAYGLQKELYFVPLCNLLDALC